jgi:phosphoribosyl 1,2-cyclic phosphodiesterase
MSTFSVQPPIFGCTILGSGSDGNSSVIHGPEGNLLLDAGFSGIEIRRRLETVGVDPASICGILVTHAHLDHVHPCGCAALARRLDIPVYLMRESISELQERKIKVPENVILFQPGFEFELCGIQIAPFEVSHDVHAVGYTFSVHGHKIGFATDLGFVSNLVKNRLGGCELLVLESNYDTTMLRKSNRRLSLKRRIASRIGHLSNANAMEALEELLAPNTKHLVLAHISRECNDPELVASLTEARLAELRREDVSFFLARQDAPLEPFCLE